MLVQVLAVAWLPALEASGNDGRQLGIRLQLEAFMRMVAVLRQYAGRYLGKLGRLFGSQYLEHRRPVLCPCGAVVRYKVLLELAPITLVANGDRVTPLESASHLIPLWFIGHTICHLLSALCICVELLLRVLA
jgi:hypothetical protein